jgi:hypothetical protein
MYIKNIGQIFKDQLPVKLRINEGSIIYGKIISQEGKSGIIKLYDGTIIPSIFISENKLPKDKYIKFLVEDFNDEEIILRILEGEEQSTKETSFNSITKRLNIPDKDGKAIIMSLIKFNLPLSDENILTLYKNINFLDKLKNMDDKEILSFINNYINENSTYESSEFIIAKDIFSALSNVDIDFLSFLIENDMPNNVSTMLKTEGFLKDGFGVNSILDKLHGILELEHDSGMVFSLEEALMRIKNDPGLSEKLPLSNLKLFIDNIDILKALYDNYNIYFFNTYSNGNTFKNNIVIKNRYKSSRQIDADNAKLFISVETPFMGVVEAYLYKKNNDITVSIRISDKYVSLLKEKVSLLKNNLTLKGYEVINISVEKLGNKTNIKGLSDFFSESIFKELDVKV